MRGYTYDRRETGYKFGSLSIRDTKRLLSNSVHDLKEVSELLREAWGEEPRGS